MIIEAFTILVESFASLYVPADPGNTGHDQIIGAHTDKNDAGHRTLCSGEKTAAYPQPEKKACTGIVLYGRFGFYMPAVHLVLCPDARHG